MEPRLTVKGIGARISVSILNRSIQRDSDELIRGTQPVLFNLAVAGVFDTYVQCGESLGTVSCPADLCRGLSPNAPDQSCSRARIRATIETKKAVDRPAG